MKEIKFTPKARLIKILGEQLIRDATVGIIELVKNSYDADATNVEIIMYSLNSDEAKIIIKDNGYGIDLDTFTTKWMNPATGHKELQKENEERTSLGRLPLGEKGVGRFAAQQIGNHLKMVSKTNNTAQELYVDIDWTKFDDREKNLAEVKIDYEQRISKNFRNSETGTILEISKLRNEFVETDIRKISNALRRMKSPFKGANDFNVKLKFEDCPDEFEKYADLSTTDLLEKSNYRFYAIVSDDGIIDYEYEFHMPTFKMRKDSGKADSLKETKENINKKINVGDFLIYLYAIQKEHRWLKSSNINKKDWDEWAGVSVYRDGIRILPYGEKGNDWLNLDNRRIQKPGELISNDQVIGMIEINQESNIHLKDKTNREGLIENEYYEKFRSLIMAAFTIFENTLYDDRQKLAPKKEKTSNEEIEQKVNDVKANLDEIKTTVEASDKYTANIAKPIINKVEQNIVDLKQQVTDTIDELEKDRQVLFNLAGTGLAAERFTHEFARMISGALSSFERLKKQIDLEKPKIKKEVNSISSALEALRNDIRLLGPMFYIKKVAKERELDIKNIIQNTISLQERFIERENIKVDVQGEGFKVFMREGSCMQVFNNLLDNSIFWCSRKSETDKKQINFIIDFKEKTVYVSDSGPGVAARYKDKIFDPFFSTKGEDGRGLGLYIAKEILDEKNFGIYLVTQDDFSGLLPGANFKIVFVGNEENNEKSSDN